MVDMDAVAQLARGQNGLVTRHQALALGMPSWTWQRGAGGLLEPVRPGVQRLVLDPVPTMSALLEQQARAAVMVGGTESAACWGTALRVAGIAGTPIETVEHVLLAGSGWHQRMGLRRHWFSVAGTDITVDKGTRYVAVSRSLRDVGAHYGDAEFLSVLDSALHLNKLGRPERRVLREMLPKRAALIDAADGRRESPLESRTALMLALDKIADVVPQVPIAVPEYGNVRVDFLLGRLVILECDGRESHDAMPTRYYDRVRHEALERMGYIVVRVTWADVVHRAAATLGRIRRALADADARERGWLPPAIRIRA